MSWSDPGNREGEREILERSPGWWSRAERLLRPGRPGRPGRLGPPGPLGRLGRWLSRLRRGPRWIAALGVLVLAGAAVGVVVTAAPAARPPVSSAPDTGIVGPGGAQAGRVTVKGGSGVPAPDPCTAFATTAAGALGPGYRTVLGEVMVPSAPLDMLPGGLGVWRHWQEATFLVRDGSPEAVISVPRPYQGSTAFGFASQEIGSSYYLQACPSGNAWTITTVGVYTTAPAACVPLRVQVGARSVTVWLGLGERCPKSRLNGRSA